MKKNVTIGYTLKCFYMFLPVMFFPLFISQALMTVSQLATLFQFQAASNNNIKLINKLINEHISSYTVKHIINSRHIQCLCLFWCLLLFVVCMFDVYESNWSWFGLVYGMWVKFEVMGCEWVSVVSHVNDTMTNEKKIE